MVTRKLQLAHPHQGIYAILASLRPAEADHACLEPNVRPSELWCLADAQIMLVHDEDQRWIRVAVVTPAGLFEQGIDCVLGQVLPSRKNAFRSVWRPTAMRKYRASTAPGGITKPDPYIALKSGPFDH